MVSHKICFITGTRAEFGLLQPLITLFEKEAKLQVELIATGAHLSPEFGYTFQQIESAGFAVFEKVEMLLSGDSSSAISKSIGLGIIGLTDAIRRVAPDWIVLLGDRYEAFAAASVAYTMKIPIVHLHGGETTEGALDEGFRHAITKFSQLHFTSTEKYRKRVIQLGESPESVFNVGAIGLDNIRNAKLLDRDALSQSIGLPLNTNFAIVTFHPATLELANVEDQFNVLLQALDTMHDTKLIFTFPNADTNGRIIIQLIEAFVRKNKDRAVAHASLGQLRYLSALKHAAFVIGNSSSGIIEAPSFGIPTINIGDRQKGRLMGPSIIAVAPEIIALKAAIEKAQSPDFQSICRQATNPYGDGNTALAILEVFKKKIASFELQKTFYDLPAWN